MVLDGFESFEKKESRVYGAEPVVTAKEKVILELDEKYGRFAH